ncbi:Chromosomal replication initiator protein DnaA [Fulvivirga imtechensis AK7]|uniref:Chromosomal replication initiator protein DnaA n=1 Tax=Fulvivirga imtechensis AK7 TaxID=1237149 RepID=L8JH16_9BACT|nr:chromosomal replication initiator protein DnaA [Fulvivirga imtechensis]ELR68156.1 Chromosomal replication initiator protein DnaA [Fulvivirga imtechensis AK7]
MHIDCETVWGDCLRVIKENVADQSFNTWFKPIVPLKCSNDVLTIQVPSQFFYEWLEEHYVHVLKKAITAVMGTQARLEYSVIVDKGNSKSSPLSVSLPNRTQAKNFGSNGAKEEYISPFQLKSVDSLYQESQLNPNNTFDSYIEGDCNRLARSAGYAVAQKPGVTSFNPLMLYGGVGLGKTHLVQAIGNEIKNNLSDRFVLYVSSEKFTNQFIDALRNNKTQEFQNFYMQVDILIIDDVQFLAGKERTQEIFFHIFNHLHQAGKQIVMTSDCPPRDLKGLQERLLSRFKWGLTADLQQPDYETRVAIIQRKMQTDGIYIPDNVIEYLAYSVDTNIRELEGVLISLIAHASLNRVDIDLELAKQTLKNIVHDIETEVGIDYIQKTVAEYFKVEVASLKDKIRKKEIVIARQVAMYFAKEYTNHSLKAIGYHFGGRDHSTVIHAVQSVNDMMDTNASFKSSVEELKKKLKMKAI